MDGAMGKEEDVVEAVLTCEGDFHDPELNSRIERFRHRLKDLLLTDKRKLQVKKVEPWNSVKVTFTIPREAAIRLRQLAQNGNDALRQMGVLSVQIQGDTQISLTIAGRNNEATQLLLRTASSASQGASSSQVGFVSGDSGISNPERFGSSPGPSMDEMTRRNIVDFFRQGILGPGAASTSGPGIGSGIPPPLDLFPGPSGSNSSFRPNNIATTVLQTQALRGSQPSSFPFTKTTGAFHAPVPRLPSSAGQSSTPTSSHPMQPGNASTSRLMGPLGHDALGTSPGLPGSGPSHLGLTTNLNSFSPVGHSKLPSASSGSNFNPQLLHIPPSSSPSSFMDLPPPPPYPHSTTSSSRPGKPVTASSPLLVNLLQTDPQLATAGMASGNPNKPLSDGDSGGAPPKKKRRSKKNKDGLVKPHLLNDNTVSSRPGHSPHLLTSGQDVSHISMVVEDSANPGLSTSVHIRDPFSVNLIQSRTGPLPTGHIPDSFIPSLRPDSKPLFSSDRPYSESHMDNPSLSGFQSDSSSRSAIGAASHSSKLSDTNGREPFPKDIDPFSMEIAAGKIINPYTGQLEPRDSVVDSGQGRVRDQSSHSQGDNFATQMLAKKAKELEDMTKKCVPNSSSSDVMDVHVMRTAIPTPISVSTSTAAVVRSGGSSSQMPSEKLTSSVPSHRRNFVSDGTAREPKESSASSSIYAGTATKPWHDFLSSADVGTRSSGHTLTNSSPLKVVSVVSNSSQQSFTPVSVPLNGPMAGGQTLKQNVITSQHQHIGPSSNPSGAPSAPSGSVIYSSVTLSSPLPISHPARVAQSLGQQPSDAVTAGLATSPSTLHTSLSRTLTTSSSVMSLSQLSSSFPSSSASSVVQASEILKSVDSTHISSNQQNQAASSERMGGTLAPKASSPNLLNSLSDKHIDSQSSTESPPDNKVSSEGDENSNHSGLATDTLPEHSGTAALLEHSGVKTENHDSGVGSSSERSDDTPSEPGDGEFRSGQPGAENEDSSKASSQKVNCKLESKVNSSSNTITVGYMMNPSDSLAQSKPALISDSSHGSKANVVTIAPTSSSSADISQFYDAHIQSIEKQTGLLTGGRQTSSVNWALEDSRGYHQPSYPSKGRENGPNLDELDNIPGMKMNGPSSQGSIEKMVMAMNDLQQKKMRSSPKQNSKKGLMEVPTEHLKLQAEVLEKMSKLHQFAETAKESSDILHKSNSSDKADSPEAFSQRLSTSEERPDPLIFDMEELVNGKTLGHAASGAEGKGGSNITSIYSKRNSNSPVNVNMLNHIYAPGLPLPRRLTESVQRLVKPLPASEMSVSTPQMRPCKSPGSGGSPRAGSGTSTHTSLRMSVQSGARSPGASMPKLIPNDKHSLLSGGLDLAGLSSLQYTSSHNADRSGLASMMVNCKKGPPSSDVLLKDPNSISSSQHSPPNLLLDSKSYSGKMLSQSYPPHKSRDLSANITQFNHDYSSPLDRNSLSLSQSSQQNQFSKSKSESSYLLSQENRFSTSSRLPLHDFITSNHMSSNVADTSQSRLAQQPSTAAESTHSSCNSHSLDHSGPYATHSNASSPIMPILQRGQEPPGTPTLAFSMPSISSQTLSVSSAKEISPTSIGSSASLVSSATVTTLNKHVPYPSNAVSASGTCGNATAKSPGVSTCLPTLSPVSTAPPSLGKADSTSAASPSYSAPPKLSLSSMGASTPPKLTKVHVSSNRPPSSPRSGSQFNRNLFESVSGTFSHDNSSSSAPEQHVAKNHSEVSGQNSHHTPHSNSDSQTDSVSSVLASNESKVDSVVRNIGQKSTESGVSRTSTSAATQKHSVDILKLSTISKPALSVGEMQNSSVSTEVVNLDASQATATTAQPVTNSVQSSALESSLSAIGMDQTVTGTQHSQPPTSWPACVSQSGHSMSQTVDTVAEVIASVAAGKDETTSSAPISSTSSSIITSSPVKEPILETLASALSSSTNTSTSKLFTEAYVPTSVTITEPRQREHEEVTRETKMVTVQSSILHKSEDHNSKQALVDPAANQTTAAQTTDASSRRVTRKRKSTHSEEDSREGETDSSSTDSTPVKLTCIGNATLPAAKTSKPMIGSENIFSKSDSVSRTDGVDDKNGHGGKVSSQSKTASVASGEPPEKGKEDKGPRVPSGSAHEGKDSHRVGRSPRTSVNESKEHGSTKEVRPHRSAGSSDESRSNRSSSNESKDSTHKESRAHRNSAAPAGDSKEVRSHRTGANSSSGEDKDLGRDGRSHRASSVDHKENAHRESSHKDHRSNRGLANAHDDKDDQKDSRPPRSASAEDKDKAKSGKEISAEKATTPDKGNSDPKHEDGQKKSHRIKRQFYAYVPEKSIDQTYFDTTILSGRTRSKNKPPDGQHNEQGAGQDGSGPVGNSVDPQSQNTGGGLQAVPGKTDAAADVAGGKRPTRAVRAKDNPQDQSASKRRRVQQHR